MRYLYTWHRRKLKPQTDEPSRSSAAHAAMLTSANYQFLENKVWVLCCSMISVRTFGDMYNHFLYCVCKSQLAWWSWLLQSSSGGGGGGGGCMSYYRYLLCHLWGVRSIQDKLVELLSILNRDYVWVVCMKSRTENDVVICLLSFCTARKFSSSPLGSKYVDSLIILPETVKISALEMLRCHRCFHIYHFR